MGNDILSRRLEWRKREERKKKLLIGILAALIVVFIFVLIWAWTEVSKMRANDAGSAPAAAETVAGTAEVPAETGASAGTETAAAESESATAPAVAPEDAWKLILVNRDHPIPEGYTVPEFTELRNGNRVDSRIYPDLQAMFDDMRSEGLLPYITSSFRTHTDQQSMMDKKISQYEAEGNSYDEAVKLAEEWVALPGTSEHEIGLSVDISSADKEKQSPDQVWSWLNENCWKYGFVQRYPENRTDVTGIINEPWHYRYVGKEAAKEMTEKGLVLEEYLGVLP